MQGTVRSGALTQAPPTILTIFGATGDLTSHYLLPAFLQLEQMGLLPKHFRLVTVGRRPISTKEFFEEFVLPNTSGADASVVKKFKSRITYYRGDFGKPESFSELSKVLADHDSREKLCFNRLYYFATSPEFFEPIAHILQARGLLMGCTDHHRTVRILVEKPFGFDLPSAQKLNRTLKKYFSETQIYRIDHYLAKETVQNLLVMRFANSFLEPLWNRFFIDHVEISALESEVVGRRAPFYDQAGALRDVVQNHLLQIVALLAMDKPRDLSPEAIRRAKVLVLGSLEPYTKKTIQTHTVRGHYGKASGIRAYADEVGKLTTTETYVALKVLLNHSRWQGVPFYIRTGKALLRKASAISVHFKPIAKNLFSGSNPFPNVLSFSMYPEEGVQLQVNNKVPGFGIRLHKSSLNFAFTEVFSDPIPTAYERLLLDFLEGDQRLFIGKEEVEAAWKWVDSTRDLWHKSDVPLHTYKPGSSGPLQAQKLLGDSQAVWWVH